MYNEKEFSVKDFILKAILVVLFVLLIMWLIPMPNLKPVYDRLFVENIETMKEAAKNYYTVERLPENVGDKVKLTLQEMLDMKLLLPIIDSENKACDTKASYVEIIKTETEYVVKTNLSCSNKTDYIIEHMGCYDLCSDNCKVEKVVEKPKQQNTKPTPKPTPKPIPTPKPEVKYLYTYEKKTTTTTKDVWSEWSTDIKYVDSDNIAFGCTATKCTEVSPNSPRREVVGTKTTTKKDASGNPIPILKESYTNLIGTYEVQACSSYDYVIYENVGTYTYPSNSSWTYVGTFKYEDAPSDTATTKYEYVGAGFADDCTGSCSSDYLLFKKYTRTASSSTTSTSHLSIKVTCSDITTKKVPFYGMKLELVGFETIRTTVYGDVKYYRYKTLLSKGSTNTTTDYQTRTYYDQLLINKGYTIIKKEVIK